MLLIAVGAHAQHPADTTARDSLKIYRDIERIARKRPYTYVIYKAIFNLPKPEQKQKQIKKAKAPNYERYKGRIIRNVYIETLDPLGYSIADTGKHPRSLLEKAGNATHRRTFAFAIKNQLLFKRGEPYDPLKIKESERILRQSEYVHDVSIVPIPIKGEKDSVDVLIREQDVWSKEIGAAWSPSSWSVDFSEKNFFGTSHQLRESVDYKQSDNSYTHQGSYTVPYIRNSFITGTAYYFHQPVLNYYGVSFNRPFYSPLARWMGGINLTKHSYLDSFRVSDVLNEGILVRYSIYDFWAGYSIPVVRKGVSEEERGTNFILTGRNLNVRYMLKPASLPDSLWQFQHSQHYLAGFGLSSRAYYRDYYIYRFGIPEDVPTGRIINFIGGQELTNTRTRWYVALQLGLGIHVPDVGYMSLHSSYGSYLYNGRTEQGVLNVNYGYFTDLISLGQWKVRQFARARYTAGYNRASGEQVYIVNDAGLKGFNSYDVYGTRRFVVNFQTQFYAPFELIGFRFAPIIFFGYAWVGPAGKSVFENTMFQNYGLGLQIKNDYLVFKTFQFTVGFYPYIPGRNGAVIKYNPVKSYQFSFSDFAIDKPSVFSFE